MFGLNFWLVGAGPLGPLGEGEGNGIGYLDGKEKHAALVVGASCPGFDFIALLALQLQHEAPTFPGATARFSRAKEAANHNLGRSLGWAVFAHWVHPFSLLIMYLFDTHFKLLPEQITSIYVSN